MGLRRRKPSAEFDALVDKAVGRLERLGDGEIMSWADAAGTGIAKAIDDYRRTREPSALQDAMVGAAGLAATVQVLRSRSAQ